MLIEFSVTNFRSFRERQTLSMVAAPRLHKKENVFEPDLVGEKGLKLLKVAAVYGPNASGKSNLLKALWTINILASRNASSEYDLPIWPFAFDPDLTNKPSEFDIHFVQKGVRYQFELAATADRIVTERLVAYPNGNAEEVYCRTGQDDADYSFGPAMDPLKDVRASWIRLTPPRMLYITQAVTNSNDGGGPLKEPYAWIKGAILNLLTDMNSWTNTSLELAQQGSHLSGRIATFLRELDVPIARLNVVKDDLAAVESPRRDGAEEKKSSSSSLQDRINRITFTHQTALGEAELPLAEESAGTRNLIGFWLPWTTRLPAENRSRCILAVDELDNSLHPKIVESLVARHIQSDNPSQLIFTTHDTHLMDSKLLRRDQIWITERDINGATQLRSIHDFVGREGEDIEKRYFEGRYRGLPLTKRG